MSRLLRLGLSSLLVLAVGACDDARDRAGAGPGTPTASEPLPCAPCTAQDRYEYEGSGIYEVPVAAGDAELSVASVTTVYEARLAVREGVLTLEYDLPARLTGVVQQVQLEGSMPDGDTPLELAGPAGSAICSLENVTGRSFDLYCVEELPGVAVDRAALEVLLQTQGLDPAMIAAHLAVSDHFNEDPIGILEATLTLDDD